MLKVKLDFRCMLCDHRDFYVSPVGEKTAFEDIIYKLDEYQLVCKKCRKTYVLDFKIVAI